MLDLSPLRALAWVRDVHALEEVGSTNDEALRLAQAGAPQGTVVIAERQTAGRGRLDRSWWSEPGGALTASWIVRPSLPLDRWTLLPLAAGVAAVDALRASGVRAGMKWPNDLVCDDRKLGGILAEARPPESVVVGVGVNISAAPPQEVAPAATSISAEGGPRIAPAELLARILERFAALLEAPDAIPDRVRAVCVTLGRQVRAERESAEPFQGVARDIDARGALLVETRDGVVAVRAGDIVHVRPFA